MASSQGALVYKICSAPLWRAAEAAGALLGAPVDLADGYIHLSTAAQVRETAARHFAGEGDLLLVAVEAAALGEALRHEPSRGGNLFPHLYGPLPLAAVRWVAPLPAGPGGHRFPDLATGLTPVTGALFRLVSPLLGALDAETAHRLTVRALALAPPLPAPADDPRLAVDLLGRRFPNPVGLAAGFDKGAEVPDALLALGFGHVEVGGVVPRPQPGNPRPRVFRLPADRAIINRFGLNSEGLAVVRARLAARAGRPGIVGANIAPNKDAADRAADYAACAGALTGLVDFLTINVSSPNTPGLRDLQGEAHLEEVVARTVAARDAAAAAVEGPARRTAVLLKIAPDIGLDALDALAATALRRGVEALVVANTTTARPSSLTERALAAQAGGLSGRPLLALSTRLLAEAYRRLEGRLPLVGVGGVDSAEAAWAKIRAGASLVQLYSGLVYEGPGLVGAIKRGLLDHLAREGHAGLAAAVGGDAERIAAGL